MTSWSWLGVSLPALGLVGHHARQEKLTQRLTSIASLENRWGKNIADTKKHGSMFLKLFLLWLCLV